MSDVNPKDRRKYKRVLVESSSKEFTFEIIGYGPTVVYDMSYSGAAFAQPKAKSISQLDSELIVHMKTQVDEAKVIAQVVRANEDFVAVEFKDMSASARVIIDRLVTDRIVGLNMNLINTQYYSSQSDFNFWYHGPKETNLYLWTHNNNKIMKAQLDMGSCLLIYEQESFVFENKSSESTVPNLNNQQIARKAFAIIEQMGHDNKAIYSLKELLRSHVQI